MKLFDYKFLILLGLTLVVYFMFREIIDLRNKIDTLESQIKNIEYNPTQKNIINNKELINNKPIIQKKPIFQIPLPKNNVEINTHELGQKTLSTIKEQEQDDTEVETESNAGSDNNEKLEIYSNDNIEDDGEYSIGDSSEIDLLAIEEELNELVTSSISESEHTESLTKEDDENQEKKNLLVKSEGTNLLKEIKNNLQMTTDIDVDNILSSNTQSHTSDMNSSHSGEYTTKSLMRMKLQDLQCIAEENSISLIHEDKGKKKTKKELSNEIVNNLKTQ